MIFVDFNYSLMIIYQSEIVSSAAVTPGGDDDDDDDGKKDLIAFPDTHVYCGQHYMYAIMLSDTFVTLNILFQKTRI